ncbi:MAG: sigma D regulator [Gammaproteobacteria bacterium]|nr:sigma D regulator [Gammaproteobacteria bacterium]
MGDSQINTIAEIAQKISDENDRRHRQTHTINELLTERQEVLVMMCELADLDPETTDIDVMVRQLKSFSQTLVDYTALGHFEIYERIIDGKERRASVSKIANRVYPAISVTTQKFVDFNDKYDGVDDNESFNGLHQDLSVIGEALAERIESEDQLLREISGRMFNND